MSSWKAELLYEPVDAARLRGSYQRAVRAPSIFELYQPQLAGDAFFAEGEPCSVGSPERTSAYQAQVEALCVAQGMPPDLLPTYFVDEFLTLDGGNPDLETERARTYTAGIVLQPKFGAALFDDVQLTFDWYQLEFDNAVQYIGATEAITNCYDPRYNAEFTPGNFWCTTFGRDPVTGEITDSVGTYWNLASVSTSGVDTQLQWSFPAGPGRLSISWFVSWIASYQFQLVPRAPTDEFSGTVGGFGGSWPDWKWNLHVGYAVGARAQEAPAPVAELGAGGPDDVGRVVHPRVVGTAEARATGGGAYRKGVNSSQCRSSRATSRGTGGFEDSIRRSSTVCSATESTSAMGDATCWASTARHKSSAADRASDATACVVQVVNDAHQPGGTLDQVERGSAERRVVTLEPGTSRTFVTPQSVQ